MTMNKQARWLKMNSLLLFNAGSLYATTAITALLGFVYWWAAARWFPPESIGMAAAIISVMMLLGRICMLGLGTLLIIELPRQPDKAESLISTALTVVGVVGGCVGLLFAYLAPYVLPAFRPLKTNIEDVAIFAMGVSLTSITMVLDQALIGLLRGGQQLWRNTLFAISKLAALVVICFWLSSRGWMSIYATWIFGSIVSLGVLVIPIVSKKQWSVRGYLPQWELLRKLRMQALQHHFFNLTLGISVTFLPVLVTVLLSVKVNAWFYVSWQIASLVFGVPFVLATVLQAWSSAQVSTLAYKARATIRIAFVVIVLANCVLQFAAEPILSLFGSLYAAQASWSLHILLLASFPIIIRNHYIAICRVHNKVGYALLTMIPVVLLELGAAALGAHLAGLVGLSIGWVAAMYVESMLMFRTVYKAVWSAEVSRTEVEKSEVAQIPFHFTDVIQQRG